MPEVKNSGISSFFKYFSDIWNEPNSIPKWSLCYSLMILSIMAAFDAYGVI